MSDKKDARLKGLNQASLTAETIGDIEVVFAYSKLSFNYSFQIVNFDIADQTVHMCKLVCALVVHIQQNRGFLATRPIEKDLK